MNNKNAIYIYLYKKNWDKSDDKKVSIGVSDIQSSYRGQKAKFTKNAKILQDEAVYKEVYNLIKKSEGDQSLNLVDKELEKALQYIVDEERNSEITKMKIAESVSTTITGMNSSTALDLLEQYGVPKGIQLIKNVNDKVNAFIAKGQVLTNAGFLDPMEVEQIKAAKGTLDRAMQDIEGSPNMSKKELAKIIGKVANQIRKAWAGGRTEFVRNVRMAIDENALDAVKKASSQIKSVWVPNQNVGKGYSNHHKSKPDNAIYIEERVQGNKKSGTVFIGISEKSSQLKSYTWGTKQTSAGSSILGGTPYNEIFDRVGSKRVENYFVNELIHSKGNILNEPNSMIMKYISAKVTSYALSGSDTGNLAYFLHMGPHLIYIPDLLTRLSQNITTSSEQVFRLSVSGFDKINNTRLPGKASMEIANQRSTQVYESIKTSLKFDVGIGIKPKDFLKVAGLVQS